MAVVGPGEELTYGELAARAHRLARHLRESGVGPEVPVGLCVGGTAERVVALLAILLAGGAYVPLDPADPAERLAFLLADCRAPLALAEPRFAALLPAAVPTLSLDPGGEAGEARAVESPAPLSGGAGPENLAYVIYTSGSTGRPKGVLTTHGGAVNLVREAVRLFAAGAETRVLQGASLGFDASVLEIFLALAAGGRLILGRDRRPLAGPELAERLKRHRVTTLATPPPLLTTLDPEELPDLSTLILGGDSCPPATAARWAPGRRLWNAYAPTEATVFATAWQAPEGAPELPAVLPIGRPIANLAAHLLDGELVPLADDPGEVGEIALGGAGLARGYLGRPDLTAERFVPNPWAGKGAPAGDRLYRSGDLGRLLPSGDLEFLGRADRQVKIRGVRVEPGEVEAALLGLPAVAEAAVVAREDVAGDRRLVAYLAAREPGGEELSARQLREDLGRLLPAAMIPGAFVLLERLPRTANGKLDRAALPAPPAPAATGESGAPRGEVEETLATLFRELLGLPRIGLKDSFFELGGHSLLAAQLAARVRRALGAELPLDLLFANPTVEQLARALGERAGGAGATEAPPLPALLLGPRPAAIPLSFPQERVWFLDRLAPGSVAYNFQCEIHLRGPLVPAALARALSEVVRRHEILRTRFPEVDGRPVQAIEPPWEVPLPLVDLAGLPAEARARAARACVAAAIRRPFAVDRLPLLGWHLVRLAPDDHLFLQIEHHLVHDGWSLAVLIGEIADLYAAFVAGKPSPLPEPALQYADFALWQRGYLAGEALETQLAWWRERLAGPPPVLELPADHPRPAAHSFRGGALLRPVAPALAAALRERSRRSGSTLFMTMFAGFAALLSRLSGQEDLAVGTGIANRRLAETERMLGMVVNTLVLRADLSGDPDFQTLLARVREAVLGAQAHQDLPFEKLVEALRPERRLAINPLFQVLFSFHDSPMPELSFGGLTGRLAAAPNGSAKADLNVVAVPAAEQRVGRGRGEAPGAGEDLEILWEYSADLFERPTVLRMFDRYLTLLEAAVAEPGRRLSDLPLLRAAERHQLVSEWNDSARPLPEEGSVHGGFRAAAAAAPERVAVVFGDAHLSYGELAARASCLAEDLAGLGVGPEVPVALYLERSPELVVAILAVLLAGGCYVPLDPTHPAERQQLILRDTGAPLLLTLARRAAEAAEIAGAVPGARTLHLDRPEGRGEAPAHPRPGSGGGDRLCVVLYTSGSTGRPKGVGISHRGVLRLVAGGAGDLGPENRVGHASNTAFDAATFELWGTLLTGATLVVLAGDEVAPRRLAAAFASGRIDVIFLTTALFAEAAREDPGAFAPLRALLFGGEAADPNRVREVLRSAPPERVVNAYGPTECTTFATFHRASSLPAGAARALRIPIGRPIGNTRALVLDRSLVPQPIGASGELCLGGAGLARGYLGRPERTAERFVPDPLSGRPGERLYRTGDLARVLPDGSLDHLGRLDGQVKVRGFRIELGEVEAALRRHPEVAEAVVTLHREGGAGEEKRLVGYVVPHAGNAGEAGEGANLAAGLRAFLKPLLPEPMIPAAFLALPALPRTPNGKLDRAALPSPEGALLAMPAVAELVPPRTPVEAAIAGLWAELLPLGGRAVGVHDNFFELGGHSLLATRVLSRLVREYGVEVPLRSLFEAPTVEALAAVVETLQEQGGAARQEPGPGLSAPLDLLARLDEMSEAEMDLLLEQMAEELEG